MFRASTCRAIRNRFYHGRQKFIRGILTDNAFFKVSPEVRDAVMGGRPVVALETTIYTHGFPYPDNIALSDHLEQTVRQHGAIPATIGVLNGIIRVGMSEEESHQLLETSRQPTTIKLSRRDISYICGLGLNGKQLNGGTTIASTMILAHLAGIKVFATGGLGGVHRGGENSMDISADLTEMGRTPVAVISSGCKSFLDLPRTLEYLETQGAGVATFSDGRGDSVNFPAFWARESQFKSPKTVRDELEAAAIIYAQSKLEINSGLFFANPIPEEYSIPQSTMDKIIAEAIQEAEKSGASGSDNTPFILDYIHKVTEGGSIRANRKLVENNIIRGSKVAVALANLEKGDEYNSSAHAAHSFMPISSNANKSKHSLEAPNVIVAGALAVDLSCDYRPITDSGDSPSLHTSNPASISQSLGGVGHNIATALHYTGTKVRLCTPIADDVAGKAALADLASRGLDTSGLRVVHGKGSTPQYVAVNDRQNSLFVAMADMRLLEQENDLFNELWPLDLAETKPEWLILDANWSSELIKAWATAGRAVGSKIAFEPVSVQKSSRLFYRTWKDRIQGHLNAQYTSTQYLADLVTPNRAELEAMFQHVRPDNAWSVVLTKLETPLEDLLKSCTGALGGLAAQATCLLSEFSCIVTKLGSDGVLLTELLFDQDPRLTNNEHDPYILLRGSNVPSSNRSTARIPPVDPDSRLADIAGLYVRHFPPTRIMAGADIISVNGAGDTFLGVLIAASMKHPHKPISDFIDIAQQASLLTLQDSSAVSPKIRDLSI